MSKLTNQTLSAADKANLRRMKKLRNTTQCAKSTGISRPTINAIIKRGTALSYQLDALREYFNNQNQ